MQLCQVPPPLKPGDLLRIIAPSGAIKEINSFQKGLDIWVGRGYRVIIDAKLHDQWGYLAGKDENRRHQLAKAWFDPECKGILCARGGYGTMRLLENWSWSKDQQFINKWIIGFSDITGLLWSLGKMGISGVHGPVLTTMGNEPEWSLQRLFNWVENHQIESLKGQGWGGGKVTGILLPANLTVATHLLGTPHQPDLQNVILAWEDVTEFPYRIDRMLTQWRLTGKLQNVKGIALGRFSQCEGTPPSFTVSEVLRDRLSDLNIPIVSDLPFGHDGENAMLPVGIMANLDGDEGILSF